MLSCAGDCAGACVSRCAGDGGGACVLTCASDGGGGAISTVLSSFAAFATKAPFGGIFDPVLCRLAAASVVDDVVDSLVRT